MSERARVSTNDRFEQWDVMLAAIRRAVSDAIRRHKALGVPIAIARDGKVVIVPPEDILIDPVTGDVTIACNGA